MLETRKTPGPYGLWSIVSVADEIERVRTADLVGPDAEQAPQTVDEQEAAVPEKHSLRRDLVPFRDVVDGHDRDALARKPCEARLVRLLKRFRRGHKPMMVMQLSSRAL
jgi:hypothetical protein